MTSGRQDRLADQARGPGDWHPDVRPGVLGEEADGPDQAAREDAERVAAAWRDDQRRALDAERLDEVERQVGRRLAQDRADDQRDRAAHGDEEDRGAERAAGADPDPRRDQRHAGGEGEHDRLEHELELGHAEVELRLEGGEADQQAADRERAPVAGDRRDHPVGERGQPARLGAVGLVAATLDDQDRAPDQGQARAADQHQVGRAPEGHVLAEDPVPDVVEREADQGEGRGGEHRDPAERRVPVAGDPHRALARLALREDDREEAGAEDAEEADEDQVVGGVGKRPGVAAVVDVQGDVPVHAEQRDQQRAGGDQRRQGGPGREPGVARREAGEPAKHVRSAGAVRPAEVEEHGGGDHRGGAGADHLPNLCAPGGGGIDRVHLGLLRRFGSGRDDRRALPCLYPM